MGFGFAWAAELPARPAQLSPIVAPPLPAAKTIAQVNDEIGTVDVIPQKHQLGKELYLENCASCHVGVPPEVMPTATWLQLIQDVQHYGQELQPLVDPTRLLVWNYLRSFSRPYLDTETTPYRVADSRFFKALHPKVKFADKPKLEGCVTCHVGAKQYDFRSLTPEWQTAP
ncbi:MAG: diheme cytochrome c [Scytolyngbya sp. HA4215-MV1]|nr:diheme cytochrome c [Scytolyngbya sp. HA4215-MV1]